MGREGGIPQGGESCAAAVRPSSALPIEYRYGTGLLGILVAGAGLLLSALLLMDGPVATVSILVSLPLLLFGVIGIAADPIGVVRSAGRRIVIDDQLMQEVNETGCVVWSIAPGQVAEVREVPGRSLFVRGALGRCAESWDILLGEGRVVRIAVWLLPHGGREFKQRFRAFINRRQRVVAHDATA